MVASKGLPVWMYHAQRDPAVFGITWVDLVFPFFLFSMGAAIPFVVERRLAAGQSKRDILLTFLVRALLLGAYSILGQHWRPYAMQDSPRTVHWLLSLFGFAALSTMFLRWPDSVSLKVRRVATGLALVAAIVPLCWITYPEGVRGIANYRNDSILMVLANVGFSGAIIYLCTRGRPVARMVVIGAVVIVTLTGEVGGISKVIWDWAPTDYLHLDGWKFARFVPILYRFYYHKYLLILLPGTLCGELLISKGQKSSSESGTLALLFFGASVVACVGLLAREMIWTTVGLAVCAGGARYFLRATDPDGDGLLSQLWLYGSVLLAFGLLAEPIGGGIRKDGPTTLSYHFVTSGLAFYAVAGLSIVLRTAKEKWLRPIVETGANPILGYLVITNLVPSLCGLTRIEDVYANDQINPWLVTLVGAIKTVAVVAIVVIATRRRLFLRA